MSIVYDDVGPVAVAAFDRPQTRNALTPAMLGELAAKLDAWSCREDLRVVVLRGVGELPFSSGYSLDDLPDRTLDVTEVRDLHAPVRVLAAAILRCAHPVIAAARRHVIGASVDVFAHCDLRVCAEGTVFCIPPAKLGLLYPAQGIARLVTVAGLSMATRLFLEGASIDDEAALACGLVQKRFAAGEFETALARYTGELAANAPLAMRGLKHALVRAAQDGAGAAADDEALAACFNSADARDGRLAAREKRPPRFTGR